ncbi:MAG: hypothetical protein U9Q30_03335 [Campylobacterota bacterium]|nr:hypothetical protein [Campylobacterota bacterium]
MSKKKGAFTLFEIMIVIIITIVLYSFAINSFTKKSNSLDDKVTLLNLKEMLLKYDFDNIITIQCNNEDLSCMVFIDGTLQEDIKISNLFNDIPTIYKHNKELDKIEYPDLNLEDMQSYQIIFKYSCRDDRKCDEFIVEDTNKIYIFNDINMKPIVYNYISDVDDYFDSKIEEVKDAF